MTAKTFAAALLMVLIGAGIADAQVFGDWNVNVTDTNVYSAVTVNDSEHAFGKFCVLDEASCYWVIEMSTFCKEGSRYPVLANVDGAVINLEVLCLGKHSGGGYGYAFVESNILEALVREAKRVGFAVPLQDDEFNVMRWNLRGVKDALSVMQQAAAKRFNKPAPRVSKGKQL